MQNLLFDWRLFGLFQISFFTNNDRQRRINFELIDNKISSLRSDNSACIYPYMADALSSFAYKIYVRGQNDLKPVAIINKTKHAFSIPAKKRSAKEYCTISFGSNTIVHIIQVSYFTAERDKWNNECRFCNISVTTTA